MCLYGEWGKGGGESDSCLNLYGCNENIEFQLHASRPNTVKSGTGNTLHSEAVIHNYIKLIRNNVKVCAQYNNGG